MSTTYQVRRTRCSGFAPPSLRMAEMLSSVWRTCATKSAGNTPFVSQPITPPVTTRRPSAAMPVAEAFGIRQTPGCRTCRPGAGASPFATGNTASVGPFDVLTDASPSIRMVSFRGHAGRGVTALRHLPQREPPQFTGLGLRQLFDKLDGTRIFVRRDLALDVLLQRRDQIGIGLESGGNDDIRLDDHAARLVGRA